MTYEADTLTLWFQNQGDTKKRECLRFKTSELDFNGYFFFAAFSGIGNSRSEHIIRSIKTFDLDKPTTGDDAEIYWQQFKEGLSDLFKKEETIDILDRFGEHSVNLQEEIKQYNK